MKTVTKMMLAATVAISGISASTAADAAVVVYTNQAAFTAAVTGATSNTFSAGAISGGLSSYTQNGVTFSQANGLFIVNDGGFGAGVPYLATDLGITTISSASSAVGFFLGQFGSSSTVTYNFGGSTGTFAVPRSPASSFLGFVNSSGPLTGSFIHANSELDFTSFVTGNAPVAAVPETATWGMMIAGFGMMGAGLRTRRRSTKVSFA